MLTIQETHVLERETKRLAIPGFRMIDYIGHNKYGLVTYVNQRLNQQTVQLLEGNEFDIRIRVRDLTIFNVYKPQSCNWNNELFLSCQHPGIYIVDFNSYSLEWGYSNEDGNREKLVNWSLVGHKHLVYNAK